MAKVDIELNETPEQQEAVEQLEAVFGKEAVDRAAGYIGGAIIPGFTRVDNLAELSYFLGAYVGASQVMAAAADLKLEVGARAFFLEDNMKTIGALTWDTWKRLLVGVAAVAGAESLVNNVEAFFKREGGQ